MLQDEMKRWLDECLLTIVLWREARGEPRDGKTAVVFSILDRVAHPRWWGQDIPTVIGKRFQYSSMAAPGDPNLILWMTYDDPSWVECLEVVREVLAGTVSNPVPNADSYYATSMKAPPDWARKAQFIGQVGHHCFYDTKSSGP